MCAIYYHRTTDLPQVGSTHLELEREPEEPEEFAGTVLKLLIARAQPIFFRALVGLVEKIRAMRCRDLAPAYTLPWKLAIKIGGGGG